MRCRAAWGWLGFSQSKGCVGSRAAPSWWRPRLICLVRSAISRYHHDGNPEVFADSFLAGAAAADARHARAQLYIQELPRIGRLKKPISGRVPCVKLFGLRAASCCFMWGKAILFRLAGGVGRPCFVWAHCNRRCAPLYLNGDPRACRMCCDLRSQSELYPRVIASGCGERWRRKHEADVGKVKPPCCEERRRRRRMNLEFLSLYATAMRASAMRC